MKQKLQNEFAWSKNIEVLKGRWEETLATDILNVKEKNIQQGKYIGIEHQSFTYGKEILSCFMVVPGLLAVPC